MQAWLDARSGQARFLASSPLWAAMLTPAAGADGARQLLGRAVALRRSIGATAAVVLDAQGQTAAVEEGADADLPPDVVVNRHDKPADGVEAVRTKVRENLKYGADWIKILVTGGVTSVGTSPQQADYTEEEIHAAVVAAQARGRDVAAHAHGNATSADFINTAVKVTGKPGVRPLLHAWLYDEAIPALPGAPTLSAVATAALEPPALGIGVRRR